MTLDTLLAEADQRMKTLVVYSAKGADVLEQFNTRNATVAHRDLPDGTTEGFVCIRDADQFRGAISLSCLETYVEPPIRRPWNLEEISAEYRAVFELLDDTILGSLSRRQLLATSREIEDRAYREGTGTLRVGFQRLSAFRAQQPVYHQLAADTSLDIHIYVAEEAPTEESATNPLTFHREPADQIDRFWFLVYDGDGDDRRNCALVAEQRDEDTYYGFWTYEPRIVDRAMAAVTDI